MRYRIDEAKFKVGDKIAKIQFDDVVVKTITGLEVRDHSTSDAYTFGHQSASISIDFIENRYVLEEELKEQHPEYWL